MNTNPIEIQPWGSVNDQEVYCYKLRNKNNAEISITNFGATITSMIIPDKHGLPGDVCLGYDNLGGYISDPFYMGGMVGRYANRIAGGNIKLDGQQYQLTVKPEGFHHHGGAEGFNKKVWQPHIINNSIHPSVKLTYLSPHMEEGFPGNLKVAIVYTLYDTNQLTIDISATADATTILNLTQHPYFNLAGHNNGNILNHRLMMPLTAYLPVSAMQVPTGEISPVAGTPFDFTAFRAIGERIGNDDQQLLISAGYDHSWVIKPDNSPKLQLAAKIYEETSGRILTVFTTEPAVHLYTGNFLGGELPGKGGYFYPCRGGLCLETQHYPDSPNHDHFPSTVLRAGDTFSSRTVLAFSVDR